VDWRKLRKLRVLGIDEIALKKGQNSYVTIVTGQLSSSEVVILAVLKDRRKLSVKEFLRSIPKKIKAGIKRVCTDMYEGFTQAVKEELPEVELVVDRFHLSKMYRECADTLRKSDTEAIETESESRRV
jgi:transposase